MRDAAILSVLLAAATLGGCKARVEPAASNVKSEADGAGTGDLATLCRGRMPPVTIAGKTASFPPRPVPGGVETLQDVSFFSTVQAVETEPGLWETNQAFGAEAFPDCLRNDTKLTTTQLAYLAGCTERSPCLGPDPAEFCVQGDCLALATPTSARGSDLPESGAENLALTSSIVCEKVPDALNGDMRLRNGSFVIGSELYGPPNLADCQALIKGAREGVVCAWTGKGFVPHRIEDGVIVGADSGYKSIPDCLALVAGARAGFVTSWDGSQFLNYSIETAKPIGVRGSDKRDPVMDDLDVVAPGHICAWTTTAFVIYNKDNVALTRFGTFANQDACHRVLKFAVEPSTAGVRIEDHPLAKLDLSKATLDEMKQLWEPEREADPTVGYKYAECHDPQYGYHLVAADAKGQLLKQCRLDTFYSWGPAVKLAYYIEKAQQKNWNGQLSGKINGKDQLIQLFMTQSPVATFAYGAIPIRIKIREDAQYKRIVGGTTRPSCETLSAAERDDTVIVFEWNLPNGTGLDYVLCSLGPVHSLSFGRQEMYDEVVKDLKWIQDPVHDYKDTELYYKVDGKDRFLGENLDGFSFSAETLTANLRTLLSETRLVSDAKIFYNPRVADKTPKAHFSTRFPIYYNQE